jgi:hypothetical protein
VLVGGSAVTISSTVREAGGYRSVGVTVLTTRVETRVGRTGSLSRRPVVTYRYTVGGRVYTSERVTRGDDWRSGSWAFDVANRFAPGRRYIGFYDAANPGTAFLFKPLELVQYILALVPLVGLLVVARAIHAWRKRAPPRGPTPGGPSAVESGLVFLHV